MLEPITYVFYGIQGEQYSFEKYGPLIISLVSLGIAIVAVWLTKRQVEIIEKNNKIMTKPNLDISLSRNHRCSDGSIDIIRVEVENSGIGPAIIKKLTIKVSGVTITESEGFIYAAQKIFNTLLDNCFAGSKIHSGEYISAGNSKPILRIQNLNITPDTARSLILEKLQVLIEYESVYGEHFICDFRKTHCSNE